jgi:hypothetical protein
MRPLNVWEKNYCPSDDPVLIERIFKRRHKIALIAAILAVPGNIAYSYFFRIIVGIPKESYEDNYLFIFNVATLFFAFFYTCLRYRCPRCNAVPKSDQVGTSGVLLFPKKCANCDAPLMPHHRWAQE